MRRTIGSGFGALSALPAPRIATSTSRRGLAQLSPAQGRPLWRRRWRDSRSLATKAAVADAPAPRKTGAAAKAASSSPSSAPALPRPRPASAQLVSEEDEVLARTTAEAYDMDALTRRLAEVSLLDSAYNILGEAIYLPHYPKSTSSGEVFIFANGSFVTWAVPKAAAEDLLSFVIRGGAADVEKHPYRDEQTESCDFVVSQLATANMRGNVIELPQSLSVEHFDESALTPLSETATAELQRVVSAAHDPVASLPSSKAQRPLHSAAVAGLPSSEADVLTRLSLSAALVRSTKLGFYEDRLSDHLDKVADIPQSLAQHRSTALDKKRIVRSYGELLDIRQGLNLNDANLLDAPEIFWEANSDDLEITFLKACRSLEVNKRLEVLNQKLDYSSNLQQVLLELTSTKTSHRLEIIIIAIIFGEFYIALVRDDLPWPFNRLYRKLVGPPSALAEHAHAV